MSNNYGHKQDVNQVIKAVYDQDERRLRVDSKITASIAELEVIIDAASGDNIALTNQDGSNFLKINGDGSLDANVAIDAAAGDNIAIKDSAGHELDINPDGTVNVKFAERYSTNVYSENSTIAVGAEVTLISVVIPAGKILTEIEIGGENVGNFEVTLSGNTIARRYLSYTSFYGVIEFSGGIEMDVAKTLEVKVTNNSLNVGLFYARVLTK